MYTSLSVTLARFWRVLCWRRGPFSAVTLYQAASISSNHLLVNMPQWNTVNSFEWLALWFFLFFLFFFFCGKRAMKWNICISYQLESLILDLSTSNWTILFRNLNFLFLLPPDTTHHCVQWHKTSHWSHSSSLWYWSDICWPSRRGVLQEGY